MNDESEMESYCSKKQLERATWKEQYGKYLNNPKVDRGCIYKDPDTTLDNENSKFYTNIKLF